MWYRQLDNSISRWAPSVSAPDALPPTRYWLARDAIIIASIQARCHSAAGLFVLITIQEVPYERHDQKAEESENDDLGSTR